MTPTHRTADDDDRDPAESDPLVLAYWEAAHALDARRADLRRALAGRFPDGSKLTAGTHEYCGGSVSLAGAEVDAVTSAPDADDGGRSVPALRLILSRKAARLAGEARVVTLSYPDLVRAGAK